MKLMHSTVRIIICIYVPYGSISRCVLIKRSESCIVLFDVANKVVRNYK